MKYILGIIMSFLGLIIFIKTDLFIIPCSIFVMGFILILLSYGNR